MRLQSIVVALGFLSFGVAARADVISESTSGIGVNLAAYYGESFTVGGTGSYADITFNYLSPTSTPYAIGTAYLFSASYSGTPDGLSSATADLLGTAVAVDGVYRFDDSVTLAAGTMYFLYGDTLTPAGVQTGGGYIPDGSYVFADSGTSDFAGDDTGLSSNFVVDGTAVTPEPSSIALLGTGVLSVALMARRRLL